MFEPVTPSRALSTTPTDIRSNCGTENPKEIVKLSGLPVTRKAFSPFFQFLKVPPLKSFFRDGAFIFESKEKASRASGCGFLQDIRSFTG